MHNILLSLDSNLFIPSLTLINSIVKTNEKNIRFFILVAEKKEEYRKMLEKNFKNYEFNIEKFNDVDDFREIIAVLKENATKNQHIFNIMNFARFYLPIVFKKIDKGIYLDIDMIVRANFDNLLKEFDYINKDFYLASPLNMECENMNLDKQGYTGKAFNAGFMVWNLKKYRDEKMINEVKELIHYQKENNAWKLGTQPILNIIYYKKVIDLDKNWNCKGFGKITEKESEEKSKLKQAENAYVIHWNSKTKPWDSDEVAGYKYWKKYLLVDK